MKANRQENISFQRVDLPERLDALTAEAAYWTIHKGLLGRHPRLRLDATPMAYISSQGVGTLARIRNDIQRRGGIFVLENLQVFAREVLTVSGLGADLCGTKRTTGMVCG